MKAFEVLAILAIGCCVWFFGGALVDQYTSHRSVLFLPTIIVTVACVLGYLRYMKRHADVARGELIPVALRLLLSLVGLACLYVAGRMVVWLVFASESDITSGNLQLKVFTYAIIALSLLALWIYGQRIIAIVRQRRG